MAKTAKKDIGEPCDWCKQGIGLQTYKCHEVLDGDYCTSEHYSEALAKEYNMGTHATQ